LNDELFLKLRQAEGTAAVTEILSKSLPALDAPLVTLFLKSVPDQISNHGTVATIVRWFLDNQLGDNHTHTDSRYGVNVNHIHANALIQICSRVNDIDTSLEIFAILRGKGIPIETATMNLCLGSFSAAQDPVNAMQFFEEMSASDVHQNATSYKHLMEMLSNVEEHNEVLKLFATMKERNVPPMVIHYSLALQACFRLASHYRGIAIFNEMKDAGMEGERRTYKYAMRICYNTKEYGRVIDAYRDLENQGIEPSLEILDLYLRASAHLLNFHEAQLALGRMRLLFPHRVTPQTLEPILRALDISSDQAVAPVCIEDVQAVVNIVSELGFEKDAATFVHLISLHSKCHEFESAREVLHEFEASTCFDPGSLVETCRVLCRGPLAPEVVRILRDDLPYSLDRLENINLKASEACALAMGQKWAEANELMSSISIPKGSRGFYGEECRIFILFIDKRYSDICQLFDGVVSPRSYPHSVWKMIIQAHVHEGKFAYAAQISSPGVAAKGKGVSSLSELLLQRGKGGITQKEKISCLIEALVRNGNSEQLVDFACKLSEGLIGQGGQQSPLDFFLAKMVILTYGDASVSDLACAAAVMEDIFIHNRSGPQRHAQFAYLCTVACKTLQGENRCGIVWKFIAELPPKVVNYDLLCLQIASAPGYNESTKLPHGKIAESVNLSFDRAVKMTTHITDLSVLFSKTITALEALDEFEMAEAKTEELRILQHPTAAYS
jgi:hypothetical protein